MKKQGILVALEGIDGSGKSTQAAMLAAHLNGIGVPSIIIKAKDTEHDHAFNEFVQTFALGNDSIGYMFAYQALHRRQYERTVQALAEGKVVIADRWNISYFVYHNKFGALSGKSEQLRADIDRLAFEGLEPTAAFFLDIRVAAAFRRRIERGEAGSFSDADKHFYTLIRTEYLRLAPAHHWMIINGEGSINNIHCKIVDFISDLLD